MTFRCGAGFVTEGVLLRTAVDYARVFPFFVTEDDCTLDANFLPVLLYILYDDSSGIRISPFLAERDWSSRLQR